jgi:hypothetical protein
MIGAIALVVTAVGAIGAVFGLRQSYRERLRQFEAMYIIRYWAIFDQLSLDVLKGGQSHTVSEPDQRAIRAYIRLCEDELEMRAAGYIGDSTYAMWADGIVQQLRQPSFKAVWTEVLEESTSSYIFLTKLTKGGLDYDPCELHDWQRRLRGLRGLMGV